MNLAIVGKIGSISCLIGFGVGGGVGGIARAIKNSTSATVNKEALAASHQDNNSPNAKGVINPAPKPAETVPPAKAEDLNIYLYAISKPDTKRSTSKPTTHKDHKEFQCQIGKLAKFDCEVSRLKGNAKKQHNMKDLKFENKTIYSDLSIAKNSFQIKFSKENWDKSITNTIQLPSKFKIIPKLTAGAAATNTETALTPAFVIHKNQQQGNMYLIAKPSNDVLIKTEVGKKFYCSFEDKKDIANECDIKLFYKGGSNNKNYSELVFEETDLKSSPTIETKKHYLIDLDSTSNSVKNQLSSKMTGKMLYVHYGKADQSVKGDQKITFNNLVGAFQPGDYSHIFVF